MVFNKCILTLCLNEIYTLISSGSRLDLCTLVLVIGGWSGLPPFQYQQSRSEMSIDNMCISVTNETSFFWEKLEWLGRVVHCITGSMTSFFNINNHLVILIDYVLTRFLPKVVWRASFFSPFIHTFLFHSSTPSMLTKTSSLPPCCDCSGDNLSH